MLGIIKTTQSVLVRACRDTASYFEWSPKKTVIPIIALFVGFTLQTKRDVQAVSLSREIWGWFYGTIEPLLYITLLFFLWNLIRAPFRIKNERIADLESQLAASSQKASPNPTHTVNYYIDALKRESVRPNISFSEHIQYGVISPRILTDSEVVLGSKKAVIVIDSFEINNDDGRLDLLKEIYPNEIADLRVHLVQEDGSGDSIHLSNPNRVIIGQEMEVNLYPNQVSAMFWVTSGPAVYNENDPLNYATVNIEGRIVATMKENETAN